MPPTSSAAPTAPWSWTWTSPPPAPGPSAARRSPPARTTSWPPSTRSSAAPAGRRRPGAGPRPAACADSGLGFRPTWATPSAGRRPTPAFDPRATPVPRRRVLLLIGAGALAAGGGLGAVLAACAGPARDRDPRRRPGRPRPGHAHRGPVHAGPGRRPTCRLRLAGEEGRPARSSPTTRAAPTGCAATTGRRTGRGSSATATTASSPWTGRSLRPAADARSASSRSASVGDVGRGGRARRLRDAQGVAARPDGHARPERPVDHGPSGPSRTCARDPGGRTIQTSPVRTRHHPVSQFYPPTDANARARTRGLP